ncbi:MAG: hypothetical protein J3Q66DRAFT_422034 [Benniella sp.]|nr:MAG: hypothetical protein J3Q66DRAFT_422034 [Benniella sp.]
MLLKSKNMTRIGDKYVGSNIIFEQVDNVEWTWVSGVETILGFEYPGDSVLELVAALFWLLEGRSAIATLRERFVCNQALQAVFLRLGIDHLLIGLMPNSVVKVTQARAQYEAAIQGHPTDRYWERFHPCKTLADAIEAVFGAVFLDCGMELAVILTLLRWLNWPAVGRYL